jgi:ribosomal-protein-alanine N-acetyltransferase
MLQHLLRVARRHRADSVFLEVRPSNHAALRLYHSAGFNEVGRRIGYYPAPKGREDAVILARTLLDAKP